MNINSLSEFQSAGTPKELVVSPVERVRESQSVDQTTQEPTAAELKQMIEKANENLKINNSDLQFEMDQEASRMIVKVIDRDTKEVLRQFPSTEMVELAKAIEKMQGVLVSKTA